MATYSRRAAKAGSWYSASPAALAAELDGFLDAATSSSSSPAPSTAPSPAVRAVIAPHAGYAWSGPTAAFAYAALRPFPAATRRVVVLGPSHHFHLDQVGASAAHTLETPVGNLRVDAAAIAALVARAPGCGAGLRVRALTQDEDEGEHSVELHLPWIARLVRGSNDVGVVPLLVGHLSAERHRALGALLAPLLADTATVFVISSDFCHWGSRFSFAPVFAPEFSIADTHRGIEKMDREAMDLIARQEGQGFAAYLDATSNTICGRNSIRSLLATLEVLREGGGSAIAILHDVRFTRYAQSSRVASLSDSSVSYASAVITVRPPAAR